ncbi:MAG: hypothetical protein KME31_14370 [Tolypothrix carrinoi HA7290-LM1]|jgi:AraC family transcriptional regulator|nr:hypothetical protein [Tolypothrix carrinoi HA7290-LM1]
MPVKRQVTEQTLTPNDSSMPDERIEISQFYNVVPQELAVESLPSHLIVIHTTPQPVQVVERDDRLKIKELAKPGDVKRGRGAGSS